MQPRQKSELSIVTHKLSRALGRCIADFQLIEPDDRVMVCMSGGKDSYTLMSLLAQYQKRSPFRFELVAVHLDQGQPGYDGAPLREWLEREGHPHRILREDTYSVVVDKLEPGKTYCSLCSRLRRGVLYGAAQELGCTKIALGHHRDDAIETLMLNLIYTGALAAMPAKLRSRDGRNVVIRPLLYAAESVIARYAELQRFPILPCNLCGSQENLKRKHVKGLLAELERIAPRARASMIAAIGNVKPAHLLDYELAAARGFAAGDGDDPVEGVAAVPAAREVEDAGRDAEPLLAEAGAALSLFGRRRLPLLHS